MGQVVYPDSMHPGSVFGGRVAKLEFPPCRFAFWYREKWRNGDVISGMAWFVFHTVSPMLVQCSGSFGEMKTVVAKRLCKPEHGIDGVFSLGEVENQFGEVAASLQRQEDVRVALQVR